MPSFIFLFSLNVLQSNTCSISLFYCKYISEFDIPVKGGILSLTPPSLSSCTLSTLLGCITLARLFLPLPLTFPLPPSCLSCASKSKIPSSSWNGHTSLCCYALLSYLSSLIYSNIPWIAWRIPTFGFITSGTSSPSCDILYLVTRTFPHFSQRFHSRILVFFTQG